MTIAHYATSTSTPNRAINGAGDEGLITITITPPASMTDGQLVVMDVIERATTLQATSLDIVNTGGQTWTSETAAGAASLTQRRHWCRFNGVWSANPSVYFDGAKANATCDIIMSVYDPTIPGSTWAQDVAFASGALSAAATLTPPAVTTITDDAVVVSCVSTVDDNTHTLTTPGNYLAALVGHNNTSGGDSCHSIVYCPKVTAGSTGTYTLTETTFGDDGGRYMNQAWREIPPALIKKLKVPMHPSAASASGVAGVVFASGAGLAGAEIGEFTGKTFEATTEGTGTAERAILIVPAADFGGSGLAVDDVVVVALKNSAFQSGIVPGVIIEE